MTWPRIARQPVRNRRLGGSTPRRTPLVFECESPNNKAADPFQESAATTIAAAGMPPEPRERDAVILAQASPLVKRADRMAPLTEMIRHAGPHARCAGPEASETRRYGRLRAPACLTPRSKMPRRQLSADRTRSRRVPAHSGCPRSDTVRNAGQGSLRGERTVDCSAGPSACERAGFMLPRGSTHALERTPTVRPDSWDFGPNCPAPQGAADDGDAASARGDMADTRQPNLGASPLASARSSVAFAVLSP